MCRFMAEYSAKCLDLQNTYLHPPCTTLHPLAQPEVVKVNSLLQQQIVQQNFHSTECHKEKALKRSGLSVLTASTLPLKGKALPWLHAAHRVPEQRHNLVFCCCCGSGPCGGPAPRRAPESGFGALQECGHYLSTRCPMSTYRWAEQFGRGTAFPCYVEANNKLTTKWGILVFSMLTAPVIIQHKHPHFTCNYSYTS